MFYNANGKLEKKRKPEHFTITDIGYRDTKFIDEKNDPLYTQYYQKEVEENVYQNNMLNNVYSKDKKVGINNKNPVGTLTVGDSSKDSDGNIVIGKKKGMQSQNYKIGIDENFWLSIGNSGNLNKNTKWKKSVRINKDAPDNSIAVSNRGLVGIGTSNPYAKLTVDSYTDSQIQRLRNKIGYYDVDIQQNIYKEDNVKFSTNTDKFNFQNPVSAQQIKLESEKNNGEPEIRMFANNGKEQLNSVNLKAKKANINGEIATNLYLGRNIKETGKDVDDLVYNAKGYVGIGNLNPQEKLHVSNGNVRIDNNLIVNGEVCFNGVCINGQDLINIKNKIGELTESVNSVNGGILPLASGISHYGSSYGKAEYYKVNNIVYVNGLIKGTSGKSHLATLPSGFTPNKRLIFIMNNHSGSYRLDVLKNGQIYWITGSRSHNWLSISGINFYVNN